MAKDYKHRVESASYKRSRQRKDQPNLLWRWLWIAALVLVFAFSLKLISKMLPALFAGKSENNQLLTATADKHDIAVTPQTSTPPVTTKAEKSPEPPAEEPRYDFYTILPQAETVIPDYEIKTRVREELVGKTKQAKYVMQAGSFRDSSEADHHKAKLALLGIESRVEKAKVGNLNWYRVKIGPYDNPSSVATIKELLQKNGIGVIVTETGK